MTSADDCVRSGPVSIINTGIADDGWQTNGSSVASQQTKTDDARHTLPGFNRRCRERRVGRPYTTFPHHLTVLRWFVTDLGAKSFLHLRDDRPQECSSAPNCQIITLHERDKSGRAIEGLTGLWLITVEGKR